MSDFGNANYSGSKKEFKKKTHYKLHEGDQTFRIIPPRGNLKESGRWSEFYSVIFGFKNMQGKLRPFASPQVRNPKTKMVDVPCAATNFIEKLKGQLKKAEEEGSVTGVARFLDLVGYNPKTKKYGIYSVDSNHHMNVVDLNGNVGELKIRHRVKKKLDTEIEKLRAKGVDPLSPDNGRYFTFSQTGKGFETDVKITVFEKEIDVPGLGSVKQELVHKIDTALTNKIREEAFDLDLLFTQLTSEEVAKVVSTTEITTGKSPACDEYFDARWKANRDNKASHNDDSMDDNVIATAPSTSAVTMNSTSPATTQVLTGQVSVGNAGATGQSTTAAFTVLAAPTMTKNIDDMSTDEFLAYCESGEA